MLHTHWLPLSRCFLLIHGGGGGGDTNVWYIYWYKRLGRLKYTRGKGFMRSGENQFGDVPNPADVHLFINGHFFQSCSLLIIVQVVLHYSIIIKHSLYRDAGHLFCDTQIEVVEGRSGYSFTFTRCFRVVLTLLLSLSHSSLAYLYTPHVFCTIIHNTLNHLFYFSSFVAYLL